MAMARDDAYLVISPNPMEFGPSPARGQNYTGGGNNNLQTPAPPAGANVSSMYLVKIGDQSGIGSRKGNYGTYNPNFFWCNISVFNKAVGGNPGIGTIIRQALFGKFQERNGNQGPTFQQAPNGTEWFFSWNNAANVFGLARNLNMAFLDQAVAMDAALRQLIDDWETNNQRPGWANDPSYDGILQFLGQNRRIVTIEDGDHGQRAVQFVNEMAAVIYLEQFIRTD